MNAKEIVILLITLPLLFNFSLWAIVSITNPSPDNIDKGVELIVESAIPWWIKIINWLSSFELIGGYLIIGFLFVLNGLGNEK